MRSHITYLGIAMLLCLFGMSAATYADSFIAQPLFTLSYGSGPGQIGVWLAPAGAEEGPPEGPSDIAVGRDGSVYLADSVNERILRFSASGDLLMEAEAPVNRNAEHVAAYERGQGAEAPPRIHQLENIQYIAVDSQGCVYVQFGASIDLLAKFAADGQPLWYVHMADAIPREVRQTYGPFFGGMTIGPGDTLRMRLTGYSVDGIAILDADGGFLRAVNGYVSTPNGRIAAFGRVAGESLATTVRMYDTDSMEIASFVAAPAATDPALFVGMSSFSGTAFDGMDNLYMSASGLRVQAIFSSSALRIGTDTVIVRLNSTGRVLAGVRFPGSPFPSSRYSTVDRAGNIYRLAYGADSVEVIKYVLHTSTPEYSSLRED